MGVRKNQASLTADEKGAFVAAVKAVKDNGMYDMMVQEHRTAMLEMSPDPAHRGSAFFPWHRECLLRFERELQAVDPGVNIPYWDWTRDRSTASSIWAPSFMGADGNNTRQKVTAGPFAYSTGQWTLTVNDTQDTPPYLRRAFGVAVGSLPSGSALERVLDTDSYSNFRPRAEALHNAVHNWVGGTMLGATSPNDPVFWMHHCMLDRVWAIWQKRHPGSAYTPASGGPVGHNIEDPMWPWAGEANPPTPASVLEHMALGYTYDDRPVISGMSPKPGSAVSATRPIIKATVEGNIYDLRKSGIELYVNGALVPASRYSFSPTNGLLRYRAPKLPKGKKVVRVVATDVAGNVGVKSWRFTLKRRRKRRRKRR